MSRYLLVDGHSVIFHWPELRKLHSRKTAQARETLIKQLQALHDSGKWRVTLIFDGTGKSVSPVDRSHMAVLYSQENQTADSVIEKIVGQQEDRSTITVVTADEAEKQTIEALGALGASPEWLAAELLVVQGELERTLHQIHHRKDS